MVGQTEGHDSLNPWLPWEKIPPPGNGEGWKDRSKAHDVYSMDSAQKLIKKAVRLKSFYTRLALPIMSVNPLPSNRPWVWGQVHRQQQMISGQFKPQELYTGKSLGQRVDELSV